MIGQTVSHYRIIEKLGGGGMGVVYRAENIKLGSHVALKFLLHDAIKDPDAMERFKREARAASSLNHPNICTVFDIDEYEKGIFIVMEFLEGKTLKSRIKQQQLSILEMLGLAAQIADGLNAAHSKGIIHRDIKPSNVFVTTGGHVKILDFGLAKLVEKDDFSEQSTISDAKWEELTRSGIAMGTLSYMSPEQALGSKLDVKTDIFSLGVTLYEMATNKLPFEGSTPAAIYEEILHGKPVVPSKINPILPAELDQVVSCALEKDPKKRDISGKEIAGECRRLQTIISSGPLFSKTNAAASRGRRHWILYALFLILALAIGYEGSKYLQNKPDSAFSGLFRSNLSFDNGMQLLRSADPRNQDRALAAAEEFENAIEQNPQNAYPYVMASKSYWMYGTFNQNSMAFGKAKDFAEQAVEVDDNNAMAHLWLARIRAFSDCNWDEAEKEYARAHELDNTLLPDADYLLWRGDRANALSAVQQHFAIDDRSETVQHSEAGWDYFYAGELDQAIAEAQKAIKINKDLTSAHWLLGYCFKYKGRANEIAAFNHFTRAFKLKDGEMARYREIFTQSRLDGILREFVEKQKQNIDLYSQAAIYAELKETDKAIGCLEAIDLPLDEPLVADPRLDSIRGDARYQAMLQSKFRIMD
jgi:serine/threonine protein kinase